MIDRVSHHLPATPTVDKVMALLGNGGSLGFLLSNPNLLSVISTMVVGACTALYFWTRTQAVRQKMRHEEERHAAWKRYDAPIQCSECNNLNPPDLTRCRMCGHTFVQTDDEEEYE